MSVFASHTTAKVPVTHDPPNTVTIRKLRGGELELAEAAHLRGFVSNRTPRGWAGTLYNIAKKAATPGETVAATAVTNGHINPLIGYDRSVVVKAALLGWTYTDHPPTPDEVDDLDDETLEFIAVEIMRLTKPLLFAAPEVVQKETVASAPGTNGAGATTA